jgi:phosphate-selective porin OprO/OprP
MAIWSQILSVSGDERLAPDEMCLLFETTLMKVAFVSPTVFLLFLASAAQAQDAGAPVPPPPAATPASATPAAGTAPPASADAAPPATPSRATPTAAGGPGDANPNAAGPGGLLIESPTSTSVVSSNPFVNRQTPTAEGGPGDPAAVAAGPGGFRIVATNNSAEIRLRALVQADGRFWFDDTQRPQPNTFLIRRAQPWVEGRLPHGVAFFLNPDFGGGTVSLQDAYLGLDLHEAIKFRFGKFRPPFGLERLQPTSNLSFVEFGLPTLLTPNRDVGAMVYGDLLSRFVGYAGGIFNGVPDNGSGDLAGDSWKEFDGRVYLRPLEPVPNHAAGRLFVGVAGTFGYVNGTPANPLLPSYKTQGQVTDFSYIAATTGGNYANTTVANGAHNRYGTYLYYAFGPLGLLGELYESDQIVGNAVKGNTWIHNTAYQAQATFLFFGAAASYDYVHVVTPVDLSARHFGALELTLRAGHLDVGANAEPNYATTGQITAATEVAAGLNWYLSDNAKLVANLDHTEFKGGASSAPEVGIGHREAENIVLLRAQVVY